MQQISTHQLAEAEKKLERIRRDTELIIEIAIVKFELRLWQEALDYEIRRQERRNEQ